MISGAEASDEGEQENLEDLRRAVEDAPVVRLVNLLLLEAVNGRASDVHLEPRRTHMEVRYRIDGELRRVRNIPRQLMAACISRIKVMADMDIAERRIPQDGRITIKVEGRQVDLRVSTLPIQYGERVVMRVLDRDRNIRRLENWGSRHATWRPSAGCSSNRTASFWSPVLPAPARPPPCMLPCARFSPKPAISSPAKTRWSMSWKASTSPTSTRRQG